MHTTGGTRVSSKNCNFWDFSKNCEKLEKSLFLRKLLSQVLQEVEGCPANTATSAISTISPKIAKKWETSQFLLMPLDMAAFRAVLAVFLDIACLARP